MRVAPESRWRVPGDRAGLVLRLLGRPVELEMTLDRLEPYRLVEYTSLQRGLPDAATNGTSRGLFDHVLVRRATERTLRETLANLQTVLQPSSVDFGAPTRRNSTRWRT